MINKAEERESKFGMIQGFHMHRRDACSTLDAYSKIHKVFVVISSFFLALCTYCLLL